MKLVLGQDITNGPGADLDGRAFVTRSITEAQQASQEELLSRQKALEAASDIPGPLKLIRKICGWIVVIDIVSFLTSLHEVSPAEMYHNAPWLSWLCCGCFALWLPLRIAGYALEGRDALAQKAETLNSDALEAVSSAWKTLGVPEESTEMDLLLCRYKREYGEIRVTRELGNRTYHNARFRAWREGNALCLADVSLRLDLPLSAAKGARAVKEGHFLTQWNKETSWREAPYRQYKMSVANGRLTARGYIAVVFSREDDDYELRVPLWEEEALTALTGLSVEHPNKGKRRSGS